VEVQVRSKGGGVYSCSYSPSSALKHTLALTWGARSVPRSPFRVSGQSRPPLAAAARAPAVPSDARVEERASASPSDPSVRAAAASQTGQSKRSVLWAKGKKALIIITTSTEERYS